jgi:hypothetical protein
VSDTFYGLDGWERLEESIEDTVGRIVDSTIDFESNDCLPDVLGRVAWPIVLFEFMHKPKPSANWALEGVLERLDENLGDTDGDPTDPSPTMLAHMQAILDEYVPFLCDPTGNTITVTREQALEMLRDEGGAK